MKHILILPDGSRIGSGPGTVNAIRSVTLTRSVNDGEFLTSGSAVAAELEIALFAPGGIALTAGQEVRLLRTDDAGQEHPLGVFLLEKPVRTSPNTMRLCGFDRLVKLDKDMTDWLSGLNGWPYPLLTLAKMVCAACGVTLVTESVPNGEYPVPRITRKGVTGRQLIRWLGEIACRYCAANPSGELEFGWYADSGIRLAPTGEHYYLQGGLTFGDETVSSPEPVDNPLLTPDAEAIRHPALRYTPCKVTLPSSTPLQPGDIFAVTAPGGETFTSLVMKRTDSPQKTTLEATGSLAGSTAHKSLGQLIRQESQNTVDAQTQADIFNKLTDNGAAQGVYMEDGQLYINASYLKSGIIDAAVVQVVNLIAEKLKSVSDFSQLTIDGAAIRLLGKYGETCSIQNYDDGTAWLYFARRNEDGTYISRSQFGADRMQIGGTWADPLLAFSTADGTPSLKIGNTLARSLSWKANGDGTYTLIGT